MSEPHLVELPEDDGALAPPQDIAAERSVIGSVLMSKAALEDVADLNPTDFYRPAHEHIWRTIREMAERGEAVDGVTVGDAIEAAGLARQTGGRAYLMGCVGDVVTASNVAHHAQIIENRATLRRVIEAGTRIAQMGYSHGAITDPLAVVDMARGELDGLAIRDDADTLPTPEAVREAIAALDEPPGTPTPWRELTQTIAGWKPSNVYVIAARPSVGKSIVGVQTALDVARRGQTAVVISMEMSRVDLFHRMLCSVGKVDMTRLQNRKLTADDHERLGRAAEHISPLPLVVDDRSHMSLAQIRSVVRKAQRRSDVGMVVVDYLGLMKSTERHSSREQEVATFSRGLKVLAKDLAVPVMLLAQVNREPDRRGGDGLPQLSDLRESGQIEADADVVLMLHRDMSPESAGEVKFLIRKNRHGPRTQINLPFQGHYSTIPDTPDW